MRISTLALLLALPLATGGCVVAGPQLAANPYPAAPPLQAEIVPRPPVSGDPLIWQPGHWDWNGASYYWTAGAWVARGGHGSNWQDGYWTTSPNTQWVWIPAHWM